MHREPWWLNYLKWLEPSTSEELFQCIAPYVNLDGVHEIAQVIPEMPMLIGIKINHRSVECQL